MAKYLLDIHIFIWVTCEADKLPKRCAEILSDDTHTIYLSMATICEMQIKNQLGKLPLNQRLNVIIDDVIKNNLYHILPITENHILNLQTLEFHHIPLWPYDYQPNHVRAFNGINGR